MANDISQENERIATAIESNVFISSLKISLQDSEPGSSAPRNSFLSSQARDLVFELDGDLRYRFASPSHEFLLGSPASQFLNGLIRDWMNDEDFVALQRHTQNAEPLAAFSLRLRHREGQFRRFEGALLPLGDGFLCACHDSSRSERLEAELDALTAIAREINVQRHINDLVLTVSQLLRPLIAFDRFFISYLEGEVLQHIAADSSDAGPFTSISRAEHPHNPVWALLESGVIRSESDFHPYEDARAPKRAATDQPTRAFINVPLLIEGQSLGLLHFDAYQPRPWTAEELRLARLVSVQLSAFIQGSRLLRQRQQQELELAQSNALLRATQEAAAEGICLIDHAGQLISYNRRFAELWPLENEAELLAAGQIMAQILSRLADPDEFLLKVLELFDAREMTANDEISLRDGRIFARYSAPATDETGRSFGRIWTFEDITQRKNHESQLAYQAFHDGVTGLPNRVLFVNHLERALSKIERTHRLVAVLFLDLDRFKIVNDSLGHEKGDQLLIQVAERIRLSLRPGDIAARFGGDEFVVLLEDVNTPEDATRVADRIASNLRAPFALGKHEVSVTASIGIVLSNARHGNEVSEGADDLLRKADVAMYRAKHKGKAQYEVFSESLSSEALGRLQLEIDLSKALKNGEIDVYYQPLVDLKSGKIRTFEALVRWHHPERGLVSPAQFIPIAEETGQIIALGAFVLRTACAQAKAWSDALGEPVLMHVNVSVRQFEQTSLPATIARILRKVGLPPAQLMLEITESAVMTDAAGAIAQLEELKKRGVGISIDDFGTGYSSLAYLEFFPIDLLKIDRAFVSRLGEGSVLVRAIASLGQAMGIEVAAEGIENAEQMERLRSMGVQWGQGFLISKPVPAAEAETLLHITF